jgi:hypothetical protein
MKCFLKFRQGRLKQPFGSIEKISMRLMTKGEPFYEEYAVLDHDE